MRKNTYIAIITIITIILIIVGVFWNVAPAMGFSLPWQKSERTSEKGEVVTQIWQAEELGECREVNLLMDAADVTLETGDRSEIRFEGNQNLMPEVKVENGCWTVTQRGKIKKYMNLHDYKNNRLVLIVPGDVQTEAVKFDVDAGDLNIKGIRTQNLVIDADAGDIDVEGVEAQALTMDVDAGDVDIINTTMPNGKVTTNMGDLKIENVSFTDLTVNLDAGNAVISSAVSLDDADLDLGVDLGRLEVNGASYGKNHQQQGVSGIRLSVKADLGNIELSW